jgi:hypothetical protein
MARFGWIAVVLALGAGQAFAGKVVDGQIGGGEYGKVISCGFPNTVKVDGSLDDLAWKAAPWHFVGAKDGTGPAPDDKDASLRFAVAADDKYLYLAVEVTDDKVQSGENGTCDVWNDDSVELYIDGGNEKAGAYDKNDAQITIGADTIDMKPDIKTTAALLGGCVGTCQGPTTETIATGKKTANGWILEAAVPLKNACWDIKPKDGLKIGFNVHYNDDDDKTGRDHKLIWSAHEVQQGEASWNNPQRFAELQFVAAVLSVDWRGKAATQWGTLKAVR